MSRDHRIRHELGRLATLAWPVAIAQAATMLAGFVDLLMVGRLGSGALAAIGLANPLIYGTLFFAVGLISGIDPVVTQAHGARDGARSARALQRGVVLALSLSIPLALAWTQTAEVLVFFGQDEALANAAEGYVRVQIPSIPFFLASAALRQYLQAREIVRPAMVVVVISNVFNFGFNWVLIFGHLGFPALGLEGAGIATAATRLLSLGLLLGFVRIGSLHRDAWVPWTRQVLRWSGFRQLLGLGIPMAFQHGLEMWAFGASNFIAGTLGAEALAGHVIVMHMASFSFMFVMGVSQATTVRVGNLIGGRRSHDAQQSAWVGVAMGASIMAGFGALFLIGRTWIPAIYTDDVTVIAVAITIVPMAAAFQIFDGVQNACCGVLRGMGRPLPAVVANGIGYWLIALPLGYWLTHEAGYGLRGLWFALTIGLVIVASGLLLWISRRGPATVAALAGTD